MKEDNGACIFTIWECYFLKLPFVYPTGESHVTTMKYPIGECQMTTRTVEYPTEESRVTLHETEKCNEKQ